MKPTSYFASLLAVVSNFCEGIRKLVLAAVSKLSSGRNEETVKREGLLHCAGYLIVLIENI